MGNDSILYNRTSPHRLHLNRLPPTLPGQWQNRQIRRNLSFDPLRCRNYDWGMIAMAVHDDWISVEKASEIAGCSEQYIRRDLDAHLPKDDKGKPTSDRTVHGKAWLVSRRSAEAIRETLSTRAKLYEAQRATKKAAKPKRARRKK